MKSGVAEQLVFRARGTIPEHGCEGAASFSARVKHLPVDRGGWVASSAATRAANPPGTDAWPSSARDCALRPMVGSFPFITRISATGQRQLRGHFVLRSNSERQSSVEDDRP